jgi:hypothetical protein
VARHLAAIGAASACPPGPRSVMPCCRARIVSAENFKTAICFHCGGLDLYPHESRQSLPEDAEPLRFHPEGHVELAAVGARRISNE